jgi:hypothetical protein
LRYADIQFERRDFDIALKIRAELKYGGHRYDLAISGKRIE